MSRESFEKARTSLTWLPAFCWQRLARRGARRPAHVLIAVADHFEPGSTTSVPARQLRVAKWCLAYREGLGDHTDSNGQQFRHTFFFPAEQYDPVVLEPLVEHCHQGWGEIEIHLHHGIERADTSENTRRMLTGFRDALLSHGCLSRWEGMGGPQYAFVHGNWALANSRHNSYCGVDDEMQILAETGCYADFTLPSAPDPAQIAKINALYECTLPLTSHAPHRRGRNLQRGRTPSNFPLMIQGPLMLRLHGRLIPRIENGELSGLHAPTLDRFHLWAKAGICVSGQPEWLFIKLHCHGLDPRDDSAMFGASIRRFLTDVAAFSRESGVRLHFMTAREMANVAMAACDGHVGDPAEFRDYRLKRVTSCRVRPRTARPARTVAY